MKNKYKVASEKFRQRTRLYHKNHREKRLDYNKKYHIAKNLIILEHYGNKCNCCGETEQKFLTIDHINNDGAKQRTQISEGVSFYNYIIKSNFPTDLQILCFNCNCGRYRNKGLCPHKENNNGTV